MTRLPVGGKDLRAAAGELMKQAAMDVAEFAQRDSTKKALGKAAKTIVEGATGLCAAWKEFSMAFTYSHAVVLRNRRTMSTATMPRSS